MPTVKRLILICSSFCLLLFFLMIAFVAAVKPQPVLAKRDFFLDPKTLKEIPIEKQELKVIKQKSVLQGPAKPAQRASKKGAKF